MASAKRKEQTLKDLYTLTRTITEPEITPVLRGSFRMQGPVDEIDCDIQTNTILSRDEKGLGKHSKSQRVLMRTESGTCNVCSAPCSSCLHINRTLMGSNTDEFSDETCQGNSGSQYSVNDVVPVKSTTCDIGQHTASETSNLLNVYSNHDSFSDNDESKASLRTCDSSGASEDIEMHPNLSSGATAGDDKLPLKPQYNYDQRVLANKLEDRKIIEGHDDSISCVSGGNEANKLASYDIGNVGRKNVPHSSALVELSSHKIDLVEISSSKDRSEGVNSPKVPSTCSCPFSGKSHSCNPNVRDLEEDLGSHVPVELPELSKEHLNSSSTKEVACRGTDDGSLVGGNSAVSDKVCLNLEVETETDKGSADLPTEAVNSSEKIEEIEKDKESCGLLDVQETYLKSQPVDDSDGSDIVEHDVKVCDICGDAGREDLLAICSRCSDGAEHTYCMREMMEKFPEGDWLCEECKVGEEIKNLKQDKVVTVDGNEKSQSSGLASALDTNLSVKLDKNDSEVEGNKTNIDLLSTKASSKRHAENIEVASAVKRQALEPTVGSPKTSTPSRIAALSRDSSFRNLDKGKVKPAHQLSSGTCSINDTSEASFSPKGPRLLTPRGMLLKSNSLNSTNAKPKVKLVDEEVPQKQKSAREPASLVMKEGAVRLIGKSMSFKSVNPGRLNSSESKVKMLSPKFSHGQDLKGLKQAKDWNLLEKKNSFKSERSLVSSATGNSTVSLSKGDKKLASSGESYALPFVSNNREPKGVQSDSKLSTLSKSTSHVARRGSETPVPLGEIKRQSRSPGVAGALSANGISSSAEQKPNQTSLMESTNFGERSRESSVNRSRPSIAAGGRSVSCQKCKEIGHSAQSCTVDNPRSLGDVSAVRSSREAMNKGNKLKAAIEAAMLKRPGIYKKNKMPDQSDELSIASTNLKCETRPQDQLSTSIITRNIFSANEVHEGHAVLQNTTAESCKQTTVNNVKQLSALPSEADTLKTGDTGQLSTLTFEADTSKNGDTGQLSTLHYEADTSKTGDTGQLSTLPSEADALKTGDTGQLSALPSEADTLRTGDTGQLSALPSEADTLKTGDTNPIDLLDAKPFLRNLPSHASAAVSVLLKMSTIPEHEYIWQGCFEVQKSGKLPELYDGFQAHLSTCASPKVLEAVNKFPSKILLNEVHRLSMWPVQFQEIGVREDNVALYFFAKDLESYEKSYYRLLETMMKSDLALKGNFDGVELLIFPSNHLPEKSQRWNMLYFLWGVFRGKKANCLQDVSGSPKKSCIPEDLPTSVMSLPESICSRGPIDGDLPTCSKACSVALASECPALMESPCLSSETINGDSDTKASALDPEGQCTQANAGGQHRRLDATSLPRIQRTCALSFQETRCTSTLLEENDDSECKLDVKLQPQPAFQVARTISGSKESDKIPMYLDKAPDSQQISSHSFDMPGRKSSSKNQVTFERTLKEEKGSLDTKPVLQRDMMMGDPSVKQLDNWQFNNGKRLHEDFTWAASQASAGISQTLSWNDVNRALLDGGCASKKQKTGYSGLYSSRNVCPLRENFTSGIHDMYTSSPVNERGEATCDNGTAERFFFPVNPLPVKDFRSGDNPVSWKVFPSEDDDLLPDGVPNLELALGAEMKPSKHGILPFLVGKVDLNDDAPDEPPEEAATKEEEDVSASLSLSLSFPFPDKERTVKPVSKVESLLPDRRRHVNTNLLLFEGLSDE